MTDPTQMAALIRAWLDILTSRHFHGWSRYARSNGLSMPQLGVLMRLHHGGSCAVSDIGKHMDITSAGASQLIDGLVQTGLVERSENPRDRRAKQLALTQQGQDFILRGIRERHDWVEDLVAALPPHRHQDIAAALAILIEKTQALEPR
jgi:DNA-binding MarR family transcriptional regulator